MSLTLPARLTLNEAPALLQQLRALGRATAGALQIDAEALVEFDSAALALVLEGARQAKEQGVALQVRQPPAKLIELARLYGVAELLSLAEPAQTTG